jgi:hypothetical protein
LREKGRIIGIQLEISRSGREGILKGTVAALKETYEMSRSGREGFLNCERNGKLLHFIRVRDFLERVARNMRSLTKIGLNALCVTGIQ